MATYTPNINLKKPSEPENFTVQDANANADAIDTAIASKAPQSTTYTKTEVDAKDALKANVAQEAWIAPTLLGSWAEYLPLTNGNVKYRKNNFGRVELYGALGTGTANTSAFTLPVGYRPPNDMTFFVSSAGTSVGKVSIGATGGVVIVAYNTVAYIGSISFPTN